jgi:nicotinamidase-related amidase
MIEKGNAAVLVIDAQLCAFDGVRFEACHNAKLLLDNLILLIKTARENKVTVVFVQHCGFPGQLYEEGTDQWIIHPAISPLADEIVVQKRQSNSFDGTELELTLNDLGIKHIITCGLQSEFCVSNTCLGALELGFSARVVSDAHSTWSNKEYEADQIITKQNLFLESKGVKCQSLKEVIA